jgi:hypothetical protein
MIVALFAAFVIMLPRYQAVRIFVNYLVGCPGEDHFEGKSATMMVSVFVAVLLARLSSAHDGPARTVDFAA